LTHKKEVLVPINLAYLYEDKNILTCYTTSNGLAAGNSIEEAILHGLCEVVERHLKEIIFFNKIKTPRIDDKTIDNPLINRFVNIFKSKGFEVFLNDYTHDLGVPTVSVFSYNKSEYFKKPPHGEFFCRTGTHPDKKIALVRAFTELLQARSCHYYKSRNSKFNKNLNGLPLYLKQNLNLRKKGEIIDYKQVADISKNNIKEEIQLIAKNLAKKGFEVILIDLTNKELNIPVVRVIIKGMQPYLNRSHGGSLCPPVRISDYLKIKV